MIRHVATIHEGLRKFKCDKCETSFPQKIHLKQHTEQYHDKIRYKCDFCPVTFGLKSSIKRHLALHNKAKISNQETDLNSKLKTQSEAGNNFQAEEDPYIDQNCDQKVRLDCEECGEHFEKGYDLRVHQESIHLKVGHYECVQCSKVFSRQSILKKHMASIHEKVKNQDSQKENILTINISKIKKHACVQCSKEFSRKSTLKDHVANVHNKENNQACQTCGKSFGLKNLRQHIHDVHETKDYSCVLCSKTFSRRSVLRDHVSFVHNKEKNHSCQLCGKSFSFRRNLDRHKTLVHDKIKKYPCKDCPFIAGQNSDLSKHTEKWHGTIAVIRCDKCEKSFDQKFHWIKHKNQCHEKIRYKCDFCPVKVGLKSSLKRHLSLHNKAAKLNHESDFLKEDLTNVNKISEVSKINIENVQSITKIHTSLVSEKKTTIEDKIDTEISESDVLIAGKDPNFDDNCDQKQRLDCEECGELFEKGYDLRVHQESMHLKVGNYECRICSKNFLQLVELTNHVEDNHQKTVTYGCNICGQAFNTDSELQQHISSDHNQYVCRVCYVSFTEKDQFRDHYTNEHLQTEMEVINVEEYSKPSGSNTSESKNPDVETKHKCDICDETFDQKVDVTRHLADIHFVEVEELEDSDID